MERLTLGNEVAALERQIEIHLFKRKGTARTGSKRESLNRVKQKKQRYNARSLACFT
jgi:hypothetical protein